MFYYFLLKNKESANRFYKREVLDYVSKKNRPLVEMEVGKDARKQELRHLIQVAKRYRYHAQTSFLTGDFELQDLQTSQLTAERVAYGRIKSIKKLPALMAAKAKSAARRLQIRIMKRKNLRDQ